MTAATATRWFVAGALLCLGSVGAALLSQHVFDMQPCPWCILQRMIFLVVAACCVLGLLWRSHAGHTVAALGVLAFSASGIAAALWQNRVAAKSETCVQTLADRIIAATGLDGALPEVFQPYASCADAAVDLFGLPYEIWSLMLFVVLGAAAIAILTRRR